MLDLKPDLFSVSLSHARYHESTIMNPGADIDTLVVGPRAVRREKHFFGSEPYCLEQILRASRLMHSLGSLSPSHVVSFSCKSHCFLASEMPHNTAGLPWCY